MLDFRFGHVRDLRRLDSRRAHYKHQAIILVGHIRDFQSIVIHKLSPCDPHQTTGTKPLFRNKMNWENAFRLSVLGKGKHPVHLNHCGSPW